MKSNSFKIFISGYDINYDNYNEIVSLLNLAFKNKIKTHDIEVLIYDENSGIAKSVRRYVNENKNIRLKEINSNKSLYDIYRDVNACLLFVSYWTESFKSLCLKCVKDDKPIIVYCCDINNGRILKRYTNDNIEDFIINQNLYDEVCSIMRREESW